MKFQLQLSANGQSVLLVIEYTCTYPQTPPIVSSVPQTGIVKEQNERLIKLLLKSAVENIGTVMVFTLAQVVTDYLEGMDNDVDDEEDSVSFGLQKPVINEAAAIRHGTADS